MHTDHFNGYFSHKPGLASGIMTEPQTKIVPGHQKIPTYHTVEYITILSKIWKFVMFTSEANCCTAAATDATNVTNTSTSTNTFGYCLDSQLF